MEPNNIPPDFDNLEKHAPTLAKLAKQNPFGVPQGYFEETHSVLKAYARFSSLDKKAGFTVPPSYFEELSDRIQNRIFLEQIPCGEAGVPEGYFDELPGIIQSRIFVEGLNKATPFTVPSGYFEALPGIIQSRISVESSGKSNAFDIPEHYFDTLDTRIGKRIAVEGSAKQPTIISLFRSNFAYVAAAASVAIIIGFTLLFSRDNSTPTAQSLAQHVVRVTSHDIKEYLAANLDENTLFELAASKAETKEDVKPTVKTNGIKKSDVVDYLLENNVDVNELQ